MEEIPKITDIQLAKHNEEVNQMVKDGVLVDWLNDQLKSLAQDNPLLYKHIMEHTQKFSMGAVMVQDPHAIAISLALEQLILLMLVGNCYKENKDLKSFSDLMSNWFSGGIEGLDDIKNED